MNKLNLIFQDEKLIDSLDDYQKEIINQLIEQNDNNYDIAAEKWLNTISTNISKFGGNQSQMSLYKEKVYDEIEKFLCDKDSYEEEKSKLKESKDNSVKFIIAFISSAIGNYLGAASAYIAPIVVLFVLNAGNISINAWCELRKEKK